MNPMGFKSEPSHGLGHPPSPMSTSTNDGATSNIPSMLKRSDSQSEQRKLRLQRFFGVEDCKISQPRRASQGNDEKPKRDESNFHLAPHASHNDSVKSIPDLKPVPMTSKPSCKSSMKAEMEYLSQSPHDRFSQLWETANETLELAMNGSGSHLDALDRASIHTSRHSPRPVLLKRRSSSLSSSDFKSLLTDDDSTGDKPKGLGCQPRHQSETDLPKFRLSQDERDDLRHFRTARMEARATKEQTEAKATHPATRGTHPMKVSWDKFPAPSDMESKAVSQYKYNRGKEAKMSLTPSTQNFVDGLVYMAPNKKSNIMDLLRKEITSTSSSKTAKTEKF